MSIYILTAKEVISEREAETLNIPLSAPSNFIYSIDENDIVLSWINPKPDEYIKNDKTYVLNELKTIRLRKDGEVVYSGIAEKWTDKGAFADETAVYEYDIRTVNSHDLESEPVTITAKARIKLSIQSLYNVANSQFGDSSIGRFEKNQVAAYVGNQKAIAILFNAPELPDHLKKETGITYFFRATGKVKSGSTGTGFTSGASQTGNLQSYTGGTYYFRVANNFEQGLDYHLQVAGISASEWDITIYGKLPDGTEVECSPVFQLSVNTTKIPDSYVGTPID